WSCKRSQGTSRHPLSRRSSPPSRHPTPRSGPRRQRQPCGCSTSPGIRPPPPTRSMRRHPPKRPRRARPSSRAHRAAAAKTQPRDPRRPLARGHTPFRCRWHCLQRSPRWASSSPWRSRAAARPTTAAPSGPRRVPLRPARRWTSNFVPFNGSSTTRRSRHRS
ncbi:MAG: hypothetical protein AVDCRST_MAG67-2417, partial [uncultured Solirubrobacteraceae bacterium]